MITTANAFYAAILCIHVFMLSSISFGQEERSAPGITEPIKDETLSASVSGIIAKINFKEGHAVKKGDVIVELNNVMEDLEVARRKLIWESKIEITSAEQRAEMMKSDLDGTRRLYETTQSVSKEELDNKELDYKLALAELETLRLAEKREEIEFEMAREQLRRRSIVAPIDGIITRLHLQEGEFCDVNQPLVRIVNTERCYFVSHVEARMTPQFSIGQKVSIRIEGMADKVTAEGEVSFIAPVVDPASGLQEIKIEIDNFDSRINPGVAGVLIFPKNNQ